MQFEYLLSIKDEKKQNYIRSRIEGAGNFFKISNPQIDCFGFCLSQQSRWNMRRICTSDYAHCQSLIVVITMHPVFKALNFTYKLVLKYVNLLLCWSRVVKHFIFFWYHNLWRIYNMNHNLFSPINTVLQRIYSFTHVWPMVSKENCG